MCSPPGDPGASRWRDRPAHGRQDDAGEGQDAADGEDGVEHPSEDVAVRRAAREDVPEDAAQARTAPASLFVEGDREDAPAKDSHPLRDAGEDEGVPADPVVALDGAAAR